MYVAYRKRNGRSVRSALRNCRALKRSVRTSVVAVLNYDGAGEQFARMVGLAREARRGWHELTAPWLRGGQPQPERALVLRVVEGKQQHVDPLLLNAQVRMVEYE